MCSVKISMYLIYPYSLKKKIHIVINQTGDKKILIKYMLNREDCMQENVCPFHLLIFGWANCFPFSYTTMSGYIYIGVNSLHL